jgi:molecular chaperone GrpE
MTAFHDRDDLHAAGAASAPEGEGTHDGAAGAEADAPRPSASGDDLDEVDVWRRELERANDALAQARAELASAEDRALRARADLENLRRRSHADLERARQQGLDAALLPVLRVHDDLVRALAAAEQSDPAAIVPGVEAVLQGLLRQLESLGLERTGAVGQPFDAERHEAILVVPAAEPELAGTIQTVFEAGFVQGDRLVRPARVIVYQEG